MADTKTEHIAVERTPTNDELDQSSKSGSPVMRSKADELSIWQSLRKNKLVGLIAMSAAFTAALDGYRKQD